MTNHVSHSSAAAPSSPEDHSLRFDNVNVWYGRHQVLRDITMHADGHTVLAIVGPANSGKTTLLKTINRTLELTSSARMSGRVLLGGENVKEISNVYTLRRRVGMVFPLPVGLPMSIYDNVAYAPRRQGIKLKADLDDIVERCLRQSVLWEEVKDRINQLGTRLSGGQQQRLTLARALSLEPEILCLDEFSIAIDPVTTMKIEEVLGELRKKMTIILVTNLTQQARRMADNVAFINASELVEWGPTAQMFGNPKKEITGRYLHGEFG